MQYSGRMLFQRSETMLPVGLSGIAWLRLHPVAALQLLWIPKLRQLGPTVHDVIHKTGNRERKCAENYNKWHNRFIFKTAISILLISSYKSFRLLFEKSIWYILLQKYIYILALEMSSAGNRHCANCIGTLSFPMYNVVHCRQSRTLQQHRVAVW